MRGFRRILLLMLLSPGGAPAAELKDFQDYLAARRELIDAMHRRRMDELNEKYLDSLRALLERVMGEGNLDRALSLRDTLERFEREGPAELGPPLAEVEGFRTLQDIWLRVRRESRAERAAELLEAYRKTDDALSKLEVRLTREGRVEEALAVRAERDRLREGPEIREMRTLVEEMRRAEKAASEQPGDSALPPTAVMGPDLVLYYAFDRDTDRRIDDRSRERNHGAADGTVWTPEGRRGGGMHFDGNASILVKNDESLQQTGDLTIGMWLKPDRLDARRNPLYKSYGAEMALTLEPDGLVNYYYGTAGRDAHPYQPMPADIELEAGSWTHLCLVRDLGNRRLVWYVNGRKTAEADAEFEKAATSDKPLVLGRGYVEPFIGTLDEVMIFGKALSGREVQWMYRSTGGT